MKKLSLSLFQKIAKAVLAVVAERGADYYGWKNSPEFDGQKFSQVQGWGDSAKPVEITPDEALAIYKSKLDGAYGERFVTSLGTIAALIANGYSVQFVQFVKEPGVPFDVLEERLAKNA